MRLDHVVSQNIPAFMMIKAAITTASVYLIDIGTRNPDSISSVFVSVLAQAPYLSTSLTQCWSIFVATMLGTLIGTIIQLITFTTDPIAAQWLILIQVPWAVATTWYLIFLIDRYDPGTTAGAIFSAQYVQYAKYCYSPLEPVFACTGRLQIAHTLIVRILALMTALIVAHLVNVIISAPVPSSIYKAQTFYTELNVWRSFQTPEANPLSGEVQFALSQLVGLIAKENDLETTISRWCFSQKSKYLVKLLASRNRAMFGYLTFRIFIHMYLRTEDNPDDKRAAEILLNMSIRTPLGASPLGSSLREEMEKITSLPQRLRVLKVVFESTIRELSERQGPPYRLTNGKPMYPFWGVI